MRALVLATLLVLGAAAPAQAAPAEVAAMDYWHYIATYATEEECDEEGAIVRDHFHALHVRYAAGWRPNTSGPTRGSFPPFTGDRVRFPGPRGEPSLSPGKCGP
ncbi:hypothetical protein F4560_003049 [Saccharothrix ecbatanensis]|uniref:Uncharacterized protein n=1 Tax=Saccharothrix ecbatanensis TaxID=1105145 RepID=A0A7W9HJL5_9PSEU|nr:hypothetical protein [Saccharothrix ecbatanensis]MBB5803281.1 hypothetical protein [Saccharothrix ecbatanensis]